MKILQCRQGRQDIFFTVGRDDLVDNPLESCGHVTQSKGNDAKDRFLSGIGLHLESPDGPVVRKIRRTARAFRMVDGVLYRQARGAEEEAFVLALPGHLRTEVLRHSNDDITAGHFGVGRTWQRVRSWYYILAPESLRM